MPGTYCKNAAEIVKHVELQLKNKISILLSPVLTEYINKKLTDSPLMDSHISRALVQMADGAHKRNPEITTVMIPLTPDEFDKRVNQSRGKETETPLFVRVVEGVATVTSEQQAPTPSTSPKTGEKLKEYLKDLLKAEREGGKKLAEPSLLRTDAPVRAGGTKDL